MFLGTHQPRLDDKGRLFLPAKYREELAEGLVITKGQERCLYVFPVEEFQRITEALRTAPVTAKAVRDYSRVFFASASDETPDKQGRITIPPGLRRLCGAASVTASSSGPTPGWRSGTRKPGSTYLSRTGAGFRRPVGGGAARDSVKPRSSRRSTVVRRGLHPQPLPVRLMHLPRCQMTGIHEEGADGDLAGRPRVGTQQDRRVDRPRHDREPGRERGVDDGA